MNVDEALLRFAEDSGLPREEMAWALENWQTASPRFIARLRAFAAGNDRTEGTFSQIFFIVHLCGQMREARAYEPLCRLIAEDPDLETVLGDATVETLPGILINVFDGDAAPLMSAIESADGNEFARGSALLALGYVTRSKGALDDEAMRACLRRLRREARPREMPAFWSCWAETASALGYEDLKMEAAVLTKDELLDPMDFGLDDFDRTVDLARGDPAGLAGFHGRDVRPFDDAIGTLESWAEDDDLESDDDVFERPDDAFPESEIVRGALRQSFPRCGPQRPVPVRQRQEIQEVLPRRLMAKTTQGGPFRCLVPARTRRPSGAEIAAASASFCARAFAQCSRSKRDSGRKWRPEARHDPCNPWL